MFSSAKQSGQATMKDDNCLFLKRNGFLEESYFSWSIIPLIGEDGSVVVSVPSCNAPLDGTNILPLAQHKLLNYELMSLIASRACTIRHSKKLAGKLPKEGCIL